MGTLKNLNIFIFTALLLFASCKQNTSSNTNTPGNQQDSITQTQPGQAQDTAASTSGVNNPGGQQETGMPVEPPKTGMANIETIELMKEPRSEKIFVMMHGTFPNPCTHMGDVSQKISGNTIEITAKTVLPQDMNCAQVIVPLHHSYRLETKNLKRGTYIINVNGKTITYEKK